MGNTVAWAERNNTKVFIFSDFMISIPSAFNLPLHLLIKLINSFTPDLTYQTIGRIDIPFWDLASNMKAVVIFLYLSNLAKMDQCLTNSEIC